MVLAHFIDKLTQRSEVTYSKSHRSQSLSQSLRRFLSLLPLLRRHTMETSKTPKGHREGRQEWERKNECNLKRVLKAVLRHSS